MLFISSGANNKSAMENKTLLLYSNHTDKEKVYVDYPKSQLCS